MKVLTVIYHENKDHYNMALKSWSSFPKDCQIIAIINQALLSVDYPNNIKYIQNDENCLAKAWNIGLKEIFKTDDVAIVSGLDSEAPDEEHLSFLLAFLRERPQCGVVAAVPLGMVTESENIRHGDGSFSFFAITKECFEAVGDFDERFKPAYFEDNDYLERLWKAGYEPKKLSNVTYFHIFQGTFKYGNAIRKAYPKFMQKNLELFKSIYGKVPEHLPKDIQFDSL